MSKVFNVAVIGCNIGRSHIAEAYSVLPEKFRVLAVCGLDVPQMKAVADEFGIPRRVTSFEEVLAMADIDIVDICTPPALHVPQSLAALAAGKHVICEKPIAGALAEVDRLIAAEAASPKTVMPIFQYRWGTGYQKALKLQRNGQLGRAYSATVETHWRRLPDYYTVPWRGKFETELGGVLVAHAIHIHDMLCGLMGPIRSVSASLATRINPIEVEDTAAAVLEMASGALVTLSCCLGNHDNRSRMRALFEHVSMESSLTPYSPGDDPWRFDTPEGADRTAIDSVLQGFGETPRRFLGQMIDYHDALLAGAPPPVTLQDARASLELITAIYHAHDTGARVSLPIGPEHPKYANWKPTNMPIKARD